MYQTALIFHFVLSVELLICIINPQKHRMIGLSLHSFRVVIISLHSFVTFCRPKVTMTWKSSRFKCHVLRWQDCKHIHINILSHHLTCLRSEVAYWMYNYQTFYQVYSYNSSVHYKNKLLQTILAEKMGGGRFFNSPSWEFYRMDRFYLMTMGM